MFNLAIVVGNLGKDPEMKYLPSGTALTTFSLATNRTYMKGEEKVEEATWHNIELWGKTAENATKLLAKGSTVLVQGRISVETWEKEGVKHYKQKIVADVFRKLSKGEAAAMAAQAATPTSAPVEDEEDLQLEIPMTPF